MLDWIIQSLESWRRLTDAIEVTLIDNLSATIPWLAPLLPAFFTYDGLLGSGLVPRSLAVIAGVVVEFLGLVTVATTVQFFDYNGSVAGMENKQRFQKKQNRQSRFLKKPYRAPVLPAGFTAAYYIVLILAVNILLDVNSNTTEKLIKALLSTIGLVGTLTMALRSQHARKIAEIRTKKEQISVARKLKFSERKLMKDPESFSPQPKTSPSSRIDWRRLPAEDRSLIAKMMPREIMDKYGIDERSAYNWLARARSSERQPEK